MGHLVPEHAIFTSIITGSCAMSHQFVRYRIHFPAFARYVKALVSHITRHLSR